MQLSLGNVKMLQSLTLIAMVPVTCLKFTGPIMSTAHAKYSLIFRKYEK